MRQLPLPPARAVSSSPVRSPCLCIHLLSPVLSLLCQLPARSRFDPCTLFSKVQSWSRPTALSAKNSTAHLLFTLQQRGPELYISIPKTRADWQSAWNRVSWRFSLAGKLVWEALALPTAFRYPLSCSSATTWCPAVATCCRVKEHHLPKKAAVFLKHWSCQ